jgi:hypothetical protein
MAQQAQETQHGYDLIPFLRGEVKENLRKGFLYWSDDDEAVFE